MLGNVSVYLSLGRFRVRNQGLLRVGRGQEARLLQHDLQLNASLLINAGSDSASFADQRLSQLMLDLFQLFIGNLLPGHLWIVRLRVLQKLIETLFLAVLFEKGVDFVIRYWRGSRHLAL